VRTGSENWFKRNKIKSENQIRSDPLAGSGSQGLDAILSTSNKKEVTIIKLNCVSIENGRMFSLKDPLNHSWIMSLNFGGTVLSRFNLIRAK
jgi:hypothetical protein